MSESVLAERAQEIATPQSLQAHHPDLDELVEVKAGMRLLAERHDYGRGGIACSIVGDVVSYIRNTDGRGFRIQFKNSIFRNAEAQASVDESDIAIQTVQQHYYWKLMVVTTLEETRGNTGKHNRG